LQNKWRKKTEGNWIVTVYSSLQPHHHGNSHAMWDHSVLPATNTHTCLTALFLGLPGLASTRKVKPIWISLKLETGEWQWHQLGHMQVCTSLQTDNHASTPPLSFFTGRMPFLPPNQQRLSTEGTSTWWQVPATKWR